MVTTHATARGALRVSLQRQDGNFDFPLEYDCDCRIGGVFAVKRAGEARPLMIVDGYAGFLAVDLRPDNTFAVSRYDDGALDSAALVDINLDGNDDIFYSYADDDLRTPPPEFRYAVWFGGRGREIAPPLGDRQDGGFRRYQSEQFLYSGISDRRDARAPALVGQVDLDADGYFDAIEGKCPQDCFYKQQPYRHMTTQSLTTLPEDLPSFGGNAFGDLDGDGLPDRVRTLQGERQQYDMQILLQTAPLTFETVARYGPLTAPSNPVIADMDNDGRNDMVVVSQNLYYDDIGWLDVLLQTRPGHFDITSVQLPMLSEQSGIGAIDLDRNGCRDIAIMQRMPQTLQYVAQFMRAFECDPATDFAVEVQGTASEPVVHVRRVMGTTPTEPRVVRATLAPAVLDGASIGFTVEAPETCAEIPAEAPRRMYDCVLPSFGATSSPGDANEKIYRFRLGLNPAASVDIQATAFLLDSAGDLYPDNNRSQLRATLSTTTATENGP